MSLIKVILTWLLFCSNDIGDSIYVAIRHLAERVKFLDSRRQKIYRAYTLSEEDKSLTLSYYKENYGKKIPLIWHKYYASYTGKYDKKYFPELIYIPELEHFMNAKSEYVATFADKNFTPLIAKSAGVTTPETVCSATNGIYRDGNYHIIDRKTVVSLIDGKGKLFFKPSIDSDSGRGCRVVNFESGVETGTGEKIDDFLKHAGKNWTIQMIVVCHETLRKLSPDSVNTFRIMTYIWNNTVFHVPSILRIGRNGSYLDNAHAGGVFVGVDDNGHLLNEAYTEFQERFTEHPDTHVKFADYSISGYRSVLECAKRMHEMIPQIGIINWDFTIDKDGEPVLIEANTKNGGIWIFQMAHGCGPFGDNTDDILQWMKQMRRIRASKRFCMPRGMNRDEHS